jgi:hypothetical protein
LATALRKIKIISKTDHGIQSGRRGAEQAQDRLIRVPNTHRSVYVAPSRTRLIEANVDHGIQSRRGARSNLSHGIAPDSGGFGVCAPGRNGRPKISDEIRACCTASL